MKKHLIFKIVWMLGMVLFFTFVYFLNTSLDYQKPADSPVGVSYAKAVVTDILSDTLQQDPDFDYIEIGKQDVEFKITSGENKGNVSNVLNFVGRVDNKPLSVGSKIIVATYDDHVTNIFVNYNRESVIYLLVFFFMFVVLFLGKLKGAKSLFSLVFTIVCIIWVFIPLVIKGWDSIVAASLIVILSIIVTMISLNGVTKKTMVAGMSCIVSTIIAGLIAYLFGRLANISTFNTPEMQDLLFVAQKTPIKINNLLFAGILISSLGAIMDTTVSITSSIFELKELNPGLSKQQLFKSGMNIGKDIMGTMTNTLILAFTGSSVNIMIIYFMYNMPYIQLINMDLIVIEIIQGLSGGIAVILSIPITALAASELIGYKKTLSDSNKGRS